ncbi:MAG: TIGR04255 family protein [Calditrichaeota bacterium]|nr:TIGR04255 family protein [Calditrichota bacterium]
MKYKKPSIVEALCEFKFFPGPEPWDITIFGQFRNRVSEKLDGERETLENVNLQIHENKPIPEIRKEPQMRFWTRDKKKLAHVSRDLVSANVLMPYPGWKEFKKFIILILKKYQDAANPGKIGKITLRYIDRLDLPAEKFQLGDWMNCGGKYLPPSLAEINEKLIYRFVRPINRNKHLGFSLRLVCTKDEKRDITLDTEAICENPKENEDISKLLDTLHDKIIETFEGSITEKFRKFLIPLEDIQ